MDQEAGVEMTARETAAARTAVRIVLEWGTCPGHDNVVVVVHVVWCMLCDACGGVHVVGNAFFSIDGTSR